MARPTKLDDLTAKRVINAARAGVSRRGAAEAARVDQATLFRWLALGRDGVAPYREFRERFLEAEAGAEREVVDALMEQARGGHVQAICFWLERRRPRDWGKTEAVANEDAAGVSEQEADDLAVAKSVVAALESRRNGTDG